MWPSDGGVVWPYAASATPLYFMLMQRTWHWGSEVALDVRTSHSDTVPYISLVILYTKYTGWCETNFDIHAYSEAFPGIRMSMAGPAMIDVGLAVSRDGVRSARTSMVLQSYYIAYLFLSGTRWAQMGPGRNRYGVHLDHLHGPLPMHLHKRISNILNTFLLP